jgi:hypothetical protein
VGPSDASQTEAGVIEMQGSSRLRVTIVLTYADELVPFDLRT